MKICKILPTIGFSVLIRRGVMAYQKIISPLLPSSCRHYPTCSEYALWSLKYNHLFVAFYKICLRILRCNQFFEGGIDYPLGHGVFEVKFLSPRKIVFWFVPLKPKKIQAKRTKSMKFYIIKSL